jgi:signal transduction histidine kinase
VELNLYLLQNLIDNAIKYSRDNSEVRVTVVKNENTIDITVADQGIGIPLANQASIFKRFFRAPNAVHLETDGTGLGLYIVESIIQRHKGTIRFTSAENVGTTFYVTLPITT